MTVGKAAVPKHTWAFAPRFRAGAFGWRSEPAIIRIKEVVSEIKAVAKKDPILGAEGAILFLQKLSAALQNIDGSSGAIGTAANRAIEVLVPIIARAPADSALRRKWLEKLYQAHADDQIPYIESLADYWGELCASPEIAAEWADRLAGTVETVFRRSKEEFGYFHGTPMALSALLASGQHERLLALIDLYPRKFWSYRKWGVQALVALGRKAEAIPYAEECRGLNEPSWLIAQACEEILLSSGMANEAYERYAFEANQAGTYLATFRAICKKYPERTPESILADLVDRTPGEEGKWFAAAKDAKLYEVALDLARKSTVDHRTLMRAVEDFAESQSGFALNCGLIALHWVCAGRAYEATMGEVRAIYDGIVKASEIAGCRDAALDAIRKTLAVFPEERLVRGALSNVLG
ncbi:MAG: hypothetical protein KKF85_11200 [Gammaproteobacteria bacterium]|nr:hypothetical protein [Rhodocyclaceae bacterium]MBU3907857.1 hypothetical protein [Gammaproteobacteria bacterium]MBU4005906.1 hypothetical protein [Gammaproteobacteria bacterium]MBU4095951.1 hypothetical protein [Gammaproteobacteria bacterium]MBU4147523.1 hypothetical protein [Gammaproteobacteria bacterium]